MAVVGYNQTEKPANAMVKLQNDLSKMERNKEGFDKFKEKLEKIDTGSWKENLQIRKYHHITDFIPFSNDLKKLLELPDARHEDLKFGYKYAKNNEVKTQEISFNVGAMSVHYLCFAFYKHDDGKSVDLVMAYYTLISTPRKVYKLDKKVESSLFGLKQVEIPEYVEVRSDVDAFQQLQCDENKDHFFRFKIMDALEAEGLAAKSKDDKIGSRDRFFTETLSTEGQSEKMIQEAICSIQYNEDAFNRFQRKVQLYKADKWDEKVEVRKYFGVDDFDTFLSDLKKMLQLTENDYIDLLCNYKYAKRGEVNKVEINYDGGKLDTRYVFYAIYRHVDSDVTDFIYAYYSLESTIKTEEVTKMQNVSYLWGLIPGPTVPVTLTRRLALEEFEGLKIDPDRDNYFRCKVLNEFAEQGLVDRARFRPTV